MFNGLGNLPLMFGAKASALGSDNFKLTRGKFAEDFYIFVVNGIDFVLAGDASHRKFIVHSL